MRVNVCTNCNNTWMADYDTAALSVIKVLTATAPQRPTDAQIQVLCLWLCKMALA